MRRNMPLYSAVMDKSYDYKKQARTLDEYIAKIPETLVGNEDSSEVFNKLKIAFDGISVSETGAFKIYATVDTVEKLLIYDDLDAVADGTVVAKVYDGERLVGTANLVFPMEGVQGETKLCGMGLSGCKENSDYKVKFTPKNLWLMEKM